MTTQRIVYTDPNNNVGVIIPTPSWAGTIEELAQKDVPHWREFKNEGESDADALTRFGVSNLDTNLTYRITDASNIPSDRTFRDAWTDDNPGETVDIDLVKARNIHLDNIRVERDKKLVNLDIDHIMTFEQNDNATKDSITAEKQALRDIPQNFDLTVATTPEELKNLWPPELV